MTIPIFQSIGSIKVGSNNNYYVYITLSSKAGRLSRDASLFKFNLVCIVRLK